MKPTRKQILAHADQVFDSVISNPKDGSAKIIFGRDNCSGTGRGEPYYPVNHEDLRIEPIDFLKGD